MPRTKCENCGAQLNFDVGMQHCFCQYCGYKNLVYDKYARIDIIKKIEKTHRHIDEAEIVKAKLAAEKDAKDRKSDRAWTIGMIVAMLLISSYFWLPGLIGRSQGKVCAGYYKDLIGQDYRSVVAHFESAGFTNIEVIDLNDAGLLVWNNEKVKTISVGGDTDFETHNYFDPDTKVIISHH